MIKASITASKVVVNDYVIAVEDTESGHKLTVSRGNEVQVMEIKDGESGGVRTINGIEPDSDGNIAINISPDDESQIDILIESDLLPAIHTNNKILTDEAGRIVLRY